MSGPSVLVVGEVVADVVEQADGTAVTHPGGSPANVAYGLARLGVDARLLTQFGQDAEGQLIRRHLERAGVKIENRRPAGEAAFVTPTAFARIDQSGAATYIFDIRWTLPHTLPETSPTHVHTGSIGALLEPGADSVEAILRALRPTSTVSFDPNVRPHLLPDHQATLDRTLRLVALSDVVKVSDEDLAHLYPGVEPAVVAREWLMLGPAIVVITLGSAGALALTHDGEVRVEPIRVSVADTVGAGDAFMSTLLHGLAADGYLGSENRSALHSMTTTSLARIAQRAALAAAITVSRPGASPPDQQELDDANRLCSQGAQSLTGDHDPSGGRRGPR